MHMSVAGAAPALGGSLRDDLLSGAADIADYLGESERATWHLIYTEQIPVIRKGRRIFARKSELDRAFSSVA